MTTPQQPIKRYRGEYGQLKQGTKVWCNGYAGAIVRHYDGATYEIRVPGGVVATDDFELTDERILHNKPADAQAAGAHTPEELDQVYKQFGSLGFSALAESYAETAAERDRLMKALGEIWPRAIKAERERDQAREQVKTLLAGLKRVQNKLGEYEGKGDRRQGELIIMAWEQARVAITAVQSEQAT